jgi:hypothetical protein
MEYRTTGNKKLQYQRFTPKHIEEIAEMLNEIATIIKDNPHKNFVINIFEVDRMPEEIVVKRNK